MRARTAFLLSRGRRTLCRQHRQHRIPGYIKYLASPEMRGRATGSPGTRKSRGYIRDQFRGMNLKPLSGDSYYQDFEVTTSARLASATPYLHHRRDKRKR